MTTDQIILSQLDQLDLVSLYEIAGFLNEFQGFSQITDLKSFLLNIIHGNSSVNGREIIDLVADLFLGQVQSSFAICSLILMISILSGLLEGITESFGNHTVSKIGSTICLLITITLSVNAFVDVYQFMSSKIDRMVESVQALFPVLIPLTLASGSKMTGATLQPMILTIITAISMAAERWMLPAVFYSCALGIVGRMVEQNFLNRIGKLLRDAVVFCLGLTVTILSAFTTIQGIAGRTADSILMKTARYSIDNFIPFIGGFAADSMDMVIQCTRAIRTAVGIWGVIIILLLMIIPLVKLLGILLVYRLSSVLTEAVGAKAISGCLEDMGSALTTLAVIYTLLGILFIVFISIIILVV